MTTRKAQASLRLPDELKEDVGKIAKATSRTLSNTIELLLKLGVAQFKRDGLLIELPVKKQRKAETVSTSEEALAVHMADLVAERLFERLRQMTEDAAAAEVHSPKHQGKNAA